MQIFDPFLIDNRYRYNISVQKDTLCLYSDSIWQNIDIDTVGWKWVDISKCNPALMWLEFLSWEIVL